MGLAVEVGILAQVREEDPDAFEYYVQQFEVVNEVLESFGLPPHQEPAELEAERHFSYEMFGYSALHYLRRIAAHLAFGGELPPPGDEQAADDPLLKDYYDLFDEKFSEGSAGEMRFQHLIMHSDAEGYYLPVEFDEVIIPDASLEIAGGMLGSSHRLLEECQELARVLELPPDLSVEEEEVWQAADAQGEGELKWQRYGIESYTCLALIQACRASVASGAAVVFT